jgi:hypothetical protein
MENNMKKTKYKKEKAVYIMRPIIDNVDLDKEEEIYIKFGRTKDMNERESTYNTCNPNKIQVIKIIYVENPKLIEDCVSAKMKEYKMKDRKEYYKCSYNQIINVVSSCIQFYENKTIDINPDINLSRINKDVFDKDKVMNLKFLKENEYIDLCESDKNQKGGNIMSDYDKYLKYKLKYLELLFDLM